MSILKNVLIASAVTTLSVTQANADMTKPANAHQFGFETTDGTRIDLSDYAGKAILVVNTASQCSFTKQYGPLQELYAKYKDRGFEIVAVPSNDFGGQEPGTNEEIVEFASQKFDVGFPITIKKRVKGSQADPFYQWAAKQVGTLGTPRWNFHKYLIGPDGKLVTWFSTITEPNSPKLQEAIEDILPEAG